MKTLKNVGLIAVLVVGSSACDAFRDQAPDNISFRMSGGDGRTVTAIYSTEFVAGVTEAGVTQVQIFGADTVVHVLPIDTIINISRNLQFFVEIYTAPTDTVNVAVRVDADDRNLYDETGGIFPTRPWQFVYQFNQRLTDVIEVVF